MDGAVLFPGRLQTLVVSEGSLGAIRQHDEDGTALVFVRRVDEQLHAVGCTARLVRRLPLPEGGLRVLVEGVDRVHLLAHGPDPAAGHVANVAPFHSLEVAPADLDQATAALRERLVAWLGDEETVPADVATALTSVHGPERLADWAAAVLPLELDQRSALLAEPSLLNRMVFCAEEAMVALEKARLDRSLDDRVQARMDQSQQEYWLKEKLKQIRVELGEPDGVDDVDRLRQRLIDAQPPEHVLREAERELERMRRMHSDAAEYHVARNWVEWLADMPWAATTDDVTDLRAAKEVLDADHHGLERIKDRILEDLAVRQLKPDARGAVLCFVGPPGVGKTSLGESISRALGRTCQRVALGGVKDEAEIRGHRRTYIGAMPGRIVQAMKRAGTKNPVIILDELDKIGQDVRGDPSSALLEVLDPAQHHRFSDHYLDVALDLSSVLFVATANRVDTIPPALLDRLETLELPGYTEEEKTAIATRHLLPRQQEAHGLVDGQLRVTRAGMTELIRRYTREAGVRNLERELARLHRKAARRIVEGAKGSVRVNPTRLRSLLGPPPFRIELAEQIDRPGVAVGLAWTPVGGEILFLEATTLPGGKGELQLTGSLGDVMKESARAALSLLRGRAEVLGLRPERFREVDFHVHVPQGAIPKDGPSAGIGLLAALASVLLGRPLPSDVAMTGEITLRGKVLPVGGVKEKVLAARRAGVKRVLLPRANEHDLDDVPSVLRRDLSFVFVDDVDSVLADVLP